MRDIPEPIPLKAQHCKQASGVLGRAFHQDPMMRLIVPDDAKRARLLPSFFAIAARYCLFYGEGYITPELDGVACWLRPGDTTPGIGRLVRIGIRGAPVGIGLPGLRRFMDVSRYADEVHARCVPGKHWYLWCIGVDPARQGQGIGGRLMQPVLAKASAEGVPCYLETMNEANLPFYEKYGFIVVNDGVVPRHGLRAWAMLRK
ncbi:MAG TPA: GNAT family N-acetyltransferase [Ktedonobacteraceae bacterium]|nr:GNAT family N-acetyltransferase [Ktedonobacteraceae bacterium]